MDGWGTEGAAVGLFWHAINEVRKFMKPDVRASDIAEIKEGLNDLRDKVENVRVDLARLNGGGKK